MDRLIERAREACDAVYIPYSGYAVDAPLRTDDGSLYTGCNIEVSNPTPYTQKRYWSRKPYANITGTSRHS